MYVFKVRIGIQKPPEANPNRYNNDSSQSVGVIWELFALLAGILFDTIESVCVCVVSI